MNILEKMTTCRSLLVLDHAFWGMLAMKWKIHIDSAYETAATDGEQLIVNEDYIESLSTQEVIGLQAHEVMHCAMGDLWRLDGRDHFIWNMACDFVNNAILVKAGFTLPQGALIENSYADKSKEEVYNILMKQAAKSKSGKGKSQGQNGKDKSQGQSGQSGNSKYQDPGKCGTMISPADAEKAKESEGEWKAAVVQAATVCQGKLPANLRRMIKDNITDPPLPWHALLRDFMQRAARNDYNWNRPNRRYLNKDIILPSLFSNELNDVVVVVDSSGSCDHAQAAFAHEISGVLSAFQTTITVMYCDAEVHGVKEYSTDELPIQLEAQGGGGTSFVPPFKYVQEHGIEPACLIYLTDLYGNAPVEEPDYPVMWVCINEQKAPWGETVHMKVSH